MRLERWTHHVVRLPYHHVERRQSDPEDGGVAEVSVKPRRAGMPMRSFASSIGNGVQCPPLAA